MVPNYMVNTKLINIERPPVYKNSRSFWLWLLWLILAELAFLTTINLPYQGEEAVYAITSLEMAINHEWQVPTLYGQNYGRPPLLNWFIVPLASVLGWEQVLIASRLVTAFTISLTTFVLMWLVQKLFNNRSLSLFTALVYMSGDVLFRRGWLAYADPLFSLFVFSAIAGLWISVLEKRALGLYLAACSLIASFLTKAITGYIFYGIAFGVLYWRHPSKRAFLLKPLSLILHTLSLLFPLVWNVFISNGAHAGGMVNDVFSRLKFGSFYDYFVKISLYPLDTIIRWLPVSGLILYFLIKRIAKKQSITHLLSANVTTAIWILGLNYLPYWLAPETYTRYLMPLYPLLALVLTFVFWQLGEKEIKIVFIFLVVSIVLRYTVGIFGLPYYQKHYRGDYQAVARDILEVVQEQPLFISDCLATGLSVAAYLDVFRLPKPPLTRPNSAWADGFLISSEPQVLNTHISKTYLLGREPLYLLCRGNACQ